MVNLGIGSQTGTVKERITEGADYPSFRGEPTQIITDDSTNHVAFNVMPDLPVKETLFIKEYRIWDGYMEAVFDREYHSSMARSPDHLMFVTVLVHMQKMLYVYLCYKFGLDYKPSERERIKIWPTVIRIEMPQLITKSRDIVHRLQVADLYQRNEKSYYIAGTTTVENIVKLDGEAVVYLI